MVTDAHEGNVWQSCRWGDLVDQFHVVNGRWNGFYEVLEGIVSMYVVTEGVDQESQFLCGQSLVHEVSFAAADSEWTYLQPSSAQF